jgi:hypothetical protein
MSLSGHGRIDDLFGRDEPVDPEESGRGVPPVVWSMLGTTLVLTAVGELLLRVLGFAPSVVLLVAVSVGVATVRLAVRSVAEPLLGRLGDVVQARPPVDLSAEHRADGMRNAIRRWTRRLEWGATGPQRYGNAVAPHLAELADQRLRQQYGLTQDSDSDRARAVLGETVWAVLHPRPGTAPSHRQIAQAVTLLAKL